MTPIAPVTLSTILLLTASVGCASAPREEATPAAATAAAPAAIAPQAPAVPVAVKGQAPAVDPFGKPGFRTFIKDGRLWVFRDGSKDLSEFLVAGEPAKSVTRPGVGPMRMSVRAVDSETIVDYLVATPGFDTAIVDGRLWVFRSGSADAAEFKAKGEPAKSVTRPGVGPMGMSVRSADSETIVAYLVAKPGFDTGVVDGRLWVFRSGSTDAAEFASKGEPAKSVTRPGAGPMGMSIRSVDNDTIVAYLAAKPGFHTEVVKERLWVLREGSPELVEFLATGEPAKSVTLPRAGPLGMSVRSTDRETIDLYLASR